MAIVHWPVMVEQTQAFHKGVQQLFPLKGIPGNLMPNPPCPIYNVGLRDAVMNADFDKAAKLVGWRHFAGGETDGTAVTGDLLLSPLPKLKSLAYGTAASQWLAAIQKASLASDLANSDFEPRLLRVPGLLLECLWLKPIDVSGNTMGWVIPFRTLFKDLPELEHADLFYQRLRAGGREGVQKREGAGCIGTLACELVGGESPGEEDGAAAGE